MGAAVAIFIFAFALFGLWIWSLIHCVTNKRLNDSMRVLGVILIVVFGILGTVIYLFLPRENAQPAVRGRRRGTGRTGSRIARGVGNGPDSAGPSSRRRAGRPGSRIARGVDGGPGDGAGSRRAGMRGTRSRRRR